MPVHAIPFFSTPPVGDSAATINVGSAFLAEHLGVHYLISAAHVPVGAQPTTNWSTWDRRMSIRTPERTINLELFSEGAEGRYTSFAFRETDREPGRLHDIIWFPLLRNWIVLREELVPHFSCFSLIPKGIFTYVEAHGYPSAVESWPSLQTAPGRVLQRVGLILETTSQTTNGFSGGPVVGENGDLVGMTIGNTGADERVSQVVPVDVIRLLVEDFAAHHPTEAP